ncbi:hypothetical protein Cadr_000007210 [Camelus dromedarius]|uniref:Uncharacterized protein n=1 Tax=Camelus dromedarius TaxID=9838 RepID=A0A5N4E4J2_CAMDR|nr:hypothetical protein Cadr_000007210 [Camelus dromedarius]
MKLFRVWVEERSLAVTSANGLHGLASLSPPPVIECRGLRGATEPLHLGSTSSNSSCGSAEYPGEAIPHHPGLPQTLLFWEAHSPIHGHSVGVPRALRIAPDLHWHDHL